MMQQHVLLQNDVPLPPATILRAGALTCMYEEGNLRYIRLGDTELVRMIYAAVRNEHWETAPYTITDETVETGADTFTIAYTANFKLREVDYEARISISGAADSTIHFAMEGVAHSAFLRNRIGLCVHHPVSTCAGRKVTVTRADGSTYEGLFPELVSPHQPFFEIQTLQWNTAGVDAALQFAGEVFEMEDQRNWSDDSYKTYGTPLSLPFPVQVQPGERLRQSITFRVEAVPQATSVTPIQPTPVAQKIPFPQIGLGCNGQPLSDPELSLLAALPIDYFQVPLFLNDPSCSGMLRRVATEAAALGAQLRLHLFFSSEIEAELKALFGMLEPVASHVASMIPLQVGQPAMPIPLLQQVYTACRQRFPHISVGYGTNDFFAELNRNLPASGSYDFVAFSLNPQVHAAYTRSVWENLGSQQGMIATIRSRLPGTPIHVAPITLKTRFDPLAATSDPARTARHIPDVRQHTAFTALWTLCTIGNLAQCACLAFYEAAGPCGVLPQAGEASPLYEALARIKQFGPKWVIQGTGSKPELLLENESGARILFSPEGNFL